MSANPLITPNFKSAEFARNVWEAQPFHGVVPADLMRPVFWAHVATQFFGQIRVRDRIEVIPESNDWFAELLVVDVQKTGLRVRVLRLVTFTDATDAVVDGVAAPAAASNDPDFDVAWKGPGAKWCVIRKADKSSVYDKLESRDAAMLKLAEHVKAKAA